MRSPKSTPGPRLNTAFDTDASFNFSERGPIVARENHYQIDISISRQTRVIKVIRGYEGEVVASKSFSNDQNAFSDFLSALDRAGYTKHRSSSLEDEQGICPLNSRYVFESDQFDKKFRLWTTSCQERGNFGGNFEVISRLFRDQIPEREQFLSDTSSTTGLEI